jgi:serine/threonine protein phosphatase PrpC/predicted Ser/Thr protein kinase
MSAGDPVIGGYDRVPHHPALEGERLQIALGQYSTAGAKPENQDFFGALEPEGADRVTKGIAVAIADGISTSRLGAQAAETAVKSFLSDYYCTSAAWSVRTAGERVIAATNSWMHAQNARARPREEGADRERGALICAFSALVLKSRTAHLFHVGDARIARIARGTIEPLTEAHTIELGGGESYLGRALGANRAVEIDYAQLPVQAGDLFMLSTDGVHEHLTPGETLALTEAAVDLDRGARAIAEAARANGSGDNLTVQLVRIETLPSGEVTDLLGTDLHLPPAPRLIAGQRFEGYAVLRELHAGSRSHVYLVRDEADGQLVALKVPATDHAVDEGELAALLIEEWVMRRVAHQNLLGAVPRRGERAHIYAVAPYVEGRTLQQWMRDNPRPSLQQVRDIVGQLASGLLALHRREMLHRDLRPANVLIDEHGTARIIDFGSVEVAGLGELGRTAKPAMFAGTVQYTAPELFLSNPASPCSDLFSLGVIAYQMLTGALPYGSAVSAATTSSAQRRLRYQPAREHDPDLPGWIDAALAKAVAIDPARRYQELSEFTYDLANPNHDLAQGKPRPLLERGGVRFWRSVALLLALALAIVLLTHPSFGPFG